MLLNCPELYVGELFSLYFFYFLESHCNGIGAFWPRPGHFEIGRFRPNPGRAPFHFCLIFSHDSRLIMALS